MMGKYIYESHTGGLYAREEAMPWEDLYCEPCGDSDWELGYCVDRDDAENTIRLRDLYTDEYIKEFLDENFPVDDGGTDNG